MHATYGTVKYGDRGFSSFSLFLFLDIIPFLERIKACNLLRMVLKIRSNGYPLSIRILMMRSKLFSWNDGCDNRSTLSIRLIIVPLLCVKGWCEKKFKNLPEKVGFRNQSKMRVLSRLIIVRSRKFNLSPPRSISIVNLSLRWNELNLASKSLR